MEISADPTNPRFWISCNSLTTITRVREPGRDHRSNEISGNHTYGQILDVDWTTERTTRVQIIVKKQDEIFQNHSLTVGPKGVVDGEHRGAVQWGCELPPESDASDFQAFILVEDFAGNGSPVSYDIKSKTPELDVGFCYQGA